MRDAALLRKAVNADATLDVGAVARGVKARVRNRRLAGAGAMSAFVACVLVLVSLRRDGPWMDVVANDAIGIRIDAGDGSTLWPVADARASLLASGDREVRVALAGGRVFFDVAKDPRRAFIVEAGAVRVEVVGTRFSVDREGERVIVSTLEGTVRVTCAGREQLVHAGEEIAWACPASAPEAPKHARPGAKTDAVARGFAIAERAIAAGEHTRAVSVLVSLESEATATAAERALAAFMAGRVLMEDLSDRSASAAAFRRAQRHAPNGPLAQDAEARLAALGRR